MPHDVFFGRNFPFDSTARRHNKVAGHSDKEQLMNLRYQHGHIRCRKRKNGATAGNSCGVKHDALGKRVRRTTLIGTIKEYPTRDLAQTVVNGLRMRINEERNRRLNHAITVSDLIDHYLATELSTPETRHSHASELSTENFLLDGSNHARVTVTSHRCSNDRSGDLASRIKKTRR
jgi:hypothetical protein